MALITDKKVFQVYTLDGKSCIHDVVECPYTALCPLKTNEECHLWLLGKNDGEIVTLSTKLGTEMTNFQYPAQVKALQQFDQQLSKMLEFPNRTQKLMSNKFGLIHATFGTFFTL